MEVSVHTARGGQEVWWECVVGVCGGSDMRCGGSDMRCGGSVW